MSTRISMRLLQLPLRIRELQEITKYPLLNICQRNILQFSLHKKTYQFNQREKSQNHHVLMCPWLHRRGEHLHYGNQVRALRPPESDHSNKKGAVAKLHEIIFFRVFHAEKDETSYRVKDPDYSFATAPISLHFAGTNLIQSRSRPLPSTFSITRVCVPLVKVTMTAF